MIDGRLLKGLPALVLIIEGCGPGYDEALEARLLGAAETERRIVDLSEVVDGAWDRACIIGPYTSPEAAQEAMGFAWDGIRRSGIANRDDVWLLAFLGDEEVEFSAVVGRRLEFLAGGAVCYARREARFESVAELGGRHHRLRNLGSEPDVEAGGRAGGLPRRPYLARSVAPAQDGGVHLRIVGEGSAAAAAGLRDGDVIRAVDGRPVEELGDWLALSATIASGSEVRFTATRDGVPVEALATLPPLPAERHDGVDVRLGSVTVPRGYRVRTIHTRPAGATGRMPAVFLAPWLSCDSVEGVFGHGGDGMMRLIHRLARVPGLVTWRVERPGVGDSEGPECPELDFEEELEAYRAGLSAALDDPSVDPARVIVLGLSNGGGFAPLLAQETPIAGYISIGGWGRTWMEHMLEHERVRLRLEGTGPADINEAMRGYASVYHEFLVEGRPPSEVPGRLSELWYGEPDGLYGRSTAFHHQLQQANLESAWTSVEAPVLVVRGGNDWIMSDADARAVANAAATRSPQVSYHEAPAWTISSWSFRAWERATKEKRASTPRMSRSASSRGSAPWTADMGRQSARSTAATSVERALRAGLAAATSPVRSSVTITAA